MRERSWLCARLTSLLSWWWRHRPLAMGELFLSGLGVWESPVSLPLQPATEIGYSLATWLDSSPDPIVPQVIAFLFTVN